MFGNYDKAIQILRDYAKQHPEKQAAVDEFVALLADANIIELEAFNRSYQAMMTDGVLADWPAEVKEGE